MMSASFSMSVSLKSLFGKDMKINRDLPCKLRMQLGWESSVDENRQKLVPSHGCVDTVRVRLLKKKSRLFP